MVYTAKGDANSLCFCISFSNINRFYVTIILWQKIAEY